MTDGHATRPLYYLFSPLITFPPWLSSECLFPSRRLWRQSQMVDQISSVTIALLVLSWVVVTMRCGVRAFLVKSFGFDDWLMLVSQVSHPPPPPGPVKWMFLLTKKQRSYTRSGASSFCSGRRREWGSTWPH